LITGTHDYNFTGRDRQTHIPDCGRDIVIGKGVWIGSNTVILGPCEIGDNAVIGACSLVNKNVAKDSIYHGIPARKMATNS
jgi:acetyltransferase-like isoleucine patch superfamily enzyme